VEIKLEDFDDDVGEFEKTLTHGDSDAAEAEAEAPENGYTQELGLFEGISNDEYHKSQGLSSTSIKPAIKSLNLFNEVMSGRVPRKQTRQMFLGGAVHALTLEAYDFGNQVAVSKKFGTKNVDKEEKAEFYAANEGKIVINTEDYERCRYMRDSLLNLEEVRDIFKTGKPEVSGYYIDKGEKGRNNGTGMLCRYRPDWENSWCMPDIKSTVDASKEAFRKTIEKFNYHVSAAHYLEGSRILTGQTHNWFPLLCVEPEPPFEAAVYLLGPKSLAMGMQLRRQALDAINASRKADEWALLNDGIAEEIEIPDWSLKDLKFYSEI